MMDRRHERRAVPLPRTPPSSAAASSFGNANHHNLTLRRLQQLAASSNATAANLIAGWYESLKDDPDPTSKSLRKWHEEHPTLNDPLLVVHAHINDKYLRPLDLFNLINQVPKHAVNELNHIPKNAVNRLKLHYGSKAQHVELNDVQQEGLMQRICGSDEHFTYTQWAHQLKYTVERLAPLINTLKKAKKGGKLTGSMLRQFAAEVPPLIQVSEEDSQEEEELPQSPPTEQATKGDLVSVHPDATALSCLKKAQLLFEFMDPDGNNEVAPVTLLKLLTGLGLFDDPSRVKATQAFMKCVGELEDEEGMISRDIFLGLSGEVVFKDVFRESDGKAMEDQVAGIFKEFCQDQDNLPVDDIPALLDALGCDDSTVLASTAEALTVRVGDDGASQLSESVLRNAFRDGDLDNIVYPPESLDEVAAPLKDDTSQSANESKDSTFRRIADPWKRVNSSVRHSKRGRRKSHSFDAPVGRRSLSLIPEDGPDGSSSTGSALFRPSIPARASSQGSSVAQYLEDYEFDDSKKVEIESTLQRYQSSRRRISSRKGRSKVSKQEMLELERLGEAARDNYMKQSNNENRLDQTQFKDLLNDQSLNEEVPAYKSDEFVNFLFDQVDINKDGYISVDEFCSSFSNLVDENMRVKLQADEILRDFHKVCFIGMRNEVDRLHDEFLEREILFDEELAQHNAKLEQEMEKTRSIEEILDEEQQLNNTKTEELKGRIKELQETVSSLNLQIETLRTELDKEKDKAARLARPDPAHAHQVRELKNKIEVLEEELARQEDANESLRESFVQNEENLKQSVADARSVIGDLQDKLLAKDSEVQNLTSRVRDENLLQQLDDTKTQLDESVHENHQLHGTVLGVEAKLDKAEDELAQYRAALAEAKRSALAADEHHSVTMKRLRDDYTAKLKLNEDTIKELNDIIKKLHDGSAGNDDVMNQLQSELRRAQAKASMAIHELEDEKHAHEQIVLSLNSKLERLQNDLQGLQKQMHNHEATSAEKLLKSDSDLAQAQRTAEAAKIEFDRLEKKNEVLASQIDQMVGEAEIERANFKAEIAALKQSLQNNTFAASENASRAALKITDLENQLNSALREAAENASREAMLKKQIGSMTTMEAEMDRIRHEASAHASRTEALEGRLNSLQDELKSARERLREHERSASEKDAEALQVCGSVAELNARIDLLNGKLLTSTKKMTALHSENSELVAKTEQYESKVQELITSLSHALNSQKIAQRKADSMFAEVNRLKAQLYNVEKQVESIDLNSAPSTFTWTGREVLKAFTTPGSFLRSSAVSSDLLHGPVPVHLLGHHSNAGYPAILNISSRSIELQPAVAGAAGKFGKWPLSSIHSYSVCNNTITLIIEGDSYTFQVYKSVN